MPDILSLTARCTMNEAPLDGEGGRVVLHCDDQEARSAGHLQVEVILNAATDAAMAPFPETRAEKQARRFLVIVHEITEQGA